jgi:hypothetical protein
MLTQLAQLNQRLCDIRTNSASSAFINLDTAFQLALFADEDINISDLSQADITELRQSHAKNLLADKRFIFGKYYVDQNGIVCSIFCLMMLSLILYRPISLDHTRASLFCELLSLHSSLSRI